MAAMLEDDVHQAVWQDYMATSVHGIGTAIMGIGGVLTGSRDAKWPYVGWYELMHPAPKDTRTGKQIVNDVLDKLGGE